MSDQGEVTRFEGVDAAKDPSYFVKFLDARKAVPEDALIKRRIIEWLTPLEGKHILEVGCGTGDDAREIARLVGPHGRVVAIDYSATMIAEARRRTADSALPVEFREGDATKLAFNDGAFDYARVERVLMHIRDAQKALEETIRVVRSGGRIIISELDHDTVFIDTPQFELTRRLLTSLSDSTASPRVGRTLARLMREAGLQNVMIEATVLNVPFQMARFAFGGHVDRCVQQELVSLQDAERWWQQLEKADGAGNYYGGAIVFTATGERP